MKINRDNVVVYVAFLMVGIVIGIGALTLSKRTQPVPINIIPPEPTLPPAPTVTPGPIKVFVNGAVGVPDLYEIPFGSRVEQAVDAAGGFSDQANATAVNLAQPLSDGMQVYVPSTDEEVVLPSVPFVLSLPANGDNEVTLGEGSGLININTATVEALDSLPGIGPSTAQKIIDFRETDGPFIAIEDLMTVPGIGEAKFADVETLITVDSP